jgi:hypothetical protein
MSGTKNLDPIPPTQLPNGRTPSDAELAPTMAGDDAGLDDDIRARAKAAGVLPVVLKAAEDEARRRKRDSTRTLESDRAPVIPRMNDATEDPNYDGSTPYQTHGVLPQIAMPTNQRKRIFFLLNQLLGTNYSAERIELEAHIRGANLGPASERQPGISPKAMTFEAK